tara:strand:+ start:338 stop:562 length:225 start_codon:yes stop_codon:yes gene_type:complete
MSLPHEALQWELKQEDDFLKKYKPVSVTIRAHYTLHMEPEDMADLENGHKNITDFDGWNDELVHVEIYDITPEE